MMPFTRRIDPELGRFLLSTSRAVAVVAGVFCIAVATLLIANYVQLTTLKPLDNPALTTLREQYRAAPDNDELASRIRALDLLARRAYFTRQWQTRTGGYLLLAGVALLLVCLRAIASLSKRLPQPRPPEPEEPGRDRRAVRAALSAVGAVLLAGALAASVLGARLVRGEQPGAGKAGPAAGARSAEAQGPELTATEAYRANWPQFRGPGGIGIAAAQDPPVDWDGPSGRNILWKAAVPRPGRNSPVVWEERIFLSGADASAREVFCWEAFTGKLLWRTPIGAAAGSPAEPPRVSDSTGYAASTMAVNGKAAFVIFATGDLASLDFEGRILWQKNLGTPAQNYGYASSLALYADSLIVQQDHDEGGRLLAVNTADGSIRWEALRRVLASWASPAVAVTGGRPLLLVHGNPLLAAYDPKRGTELWRLAGMMGENAPSPAFAEGRVFAANQLLSLVAVEARTGKKLWETYDDLPDVASPLATGELLVMAASFGVVTCLAAADGTPLWKQEFSTGFYASPILAGGRLYLLDRSGVMRIMAAERTARLLGSPALGEPAEATPALRGGSIFIRGARHLFCIRGGGGRS
jgi:outer membrane protein assembly factor BamB